MSDTRTSRRTLLKGAGAVALSAPMLPFLKVLPASASRGDTAVVVIGQTINSLDIHRKGTNRPSYQIAVNCYDRLVSFGTKTLEDGTLSYDYASLEPDLAEMDLAAFREGNRRRVKNLHATMQALYESVSGPGSFLVSATRLGGLHGQTAEGATAPLGGAVAGFTKSYKREQAEVLSKARAR